jgi:hypothetical protein
MTKEQREALATAGAELASRMVAFRDMVELLCDANDCEDEALDDALDILMDAIGEPEKIAEGLAELEGVELVEPAT